MITVAQLSAPQRVCLRHFVEIDSRGAADGFKFGAATLTSLRQLGLIEKFRGYPWPGAKEHNMWRATTEGRAVFPEVTSTREDVTDSQIRALQAEAGAAGDLVMVRECRIACGDEETSTQSDIQLARAECARVIAEAVQP